MAALALTASACGTTHKSTAPTKELSSNPATAISQAYRATTTPGAASFVISSVTTGPGGQDQTATGNTTPSFDTGQITLQNAGHPNMVVLDHGGEEFVHLPPSLRTLASGKPWLSINVAVVSLSTLASTPYYAILPNVQFIRHLVLVSAVVPSSAKVVGHGQVGGVATTEYAGTVDLAKGATEGNTAPLRAEAFRLEKYLGRSSFPIRVWLDSSGRVRKLSYSVAIVHHAGAKPEPTAISTTMEIHGFGKRAAISYPHPSQVTDITQQLNLANGSSGSG